MKFKSPFTHHALERILERYGTRFTKQRQLAFVRTLQNPKFTIPLTDNRRACYFEGKWYLLVCSQSPRPLSSIIAIQTFLRLEDANEDDKLVLRHSDRYIKINDDAFGVLSMSERKSIDRPCKKLVELSELSDSELPHDQIKSADRILKSICTDK